MFAGYGTLAVCTAKARASPLRGQFRICCFFPLNWYLSTLDFVIEKSLYSSEFIRELFWSLILFMMGIRG